METSSIGSSNLPVSSANEAQTHGRVQAKLDFIVNHEAVPAAPSIPRDIATDLVVSVLKHSFPSLDEDQARQMAKSMLHKAVADAANKAALTSSKDSSVDVSA